MATSVVNATVRPDKPSRVALTSVWVVIGLVVVAALVAVNANWSALLGFPSEAAKYAQRLFLPPAWNRAGEALAAMMLSVQMAWIGSLLAIVVSFPLSFLATRGLAPVWVRVPVRLVFAILRAVPEVVIAILILAVTGLTPLTGALALGVGAMGTLGKWGYEAFESVDRGVVEAVRASGAGVLGVSCWAVWTQAKPTVLAFWLYRFEISVRASAILGLIGAGGIGKMLQDNVQFRNWDVVGMLMIVVIVVTMLIDQVSGALRHRIIHGRWALVGYGRRRRTLRPQG